MFDIPSIATAEKLISIQDESPKMDQETRDLRIRIIGAGMGGLACALALAKEGFEDIEVYESASNLGFVGAGIQLAPNMARVLDRLGVWKDIEREAVPLRDTSIRRMQPPIPIPGCD